MGIAAYNRGSLAVSRGLSEDYKNSRSARKERVDRFVRMELRIADLELFIRDAQSAFVDLQDEDTAIGFALSNARHFWLRKRNTRKFALLHGECVSSHVSWVNSDRRYTASHLQHCYAKARAWNAVLNLLNPHFKWKFEVPHYL